MISAQPYTCFEFMNTRYIIYIGAILKTVADLNITLDRSYHKMSNTLHDMHGMLELKKSLGA